MEIMRNDGNRGRVINLLEYAGKITNLQGMVFDLDKIKDDRKIFFDGNVGNGHVFRPGDTDYATIRAMAFALDSNPSLEILAGNSIIYYKDDKRTIYYPAFVRKVRLTKDDALNNYTMEYIDNATSLSLAADTVNLELDENHKLSLSFRQYNPAIGIEVLVDYDKIEPLATFDDITSGNLRGTFNRLDNPANAVDGTWYLYTKPVLFVEKKSDYLMEKVIDEIRAGGEYPAFFDAIVNRLNLNIYNNMLEYSLIGNSIEPKLTDNMHNIGGEDLDITFASDLTSKMHREIVMTLEDKENRAAAVLVLGPPGSGKTVAIANISAYYAAKGEKVLVISHSKDALGVLVKKLKESVLQKAFLFLDGDSSTSLKENVRDFINYCEEARRDRERNNNIATNLTADRNNLFDIITTCRDEMAQMILDENTLSAGQPLYRSVVNLINGGVVKIPDNLTDADIELLYRKFSATMDVLTASALPNPTELINPSDFSRLKIPAHTPIAVDGMPLTTFRITDGRIELVMNGMSYPVEAATGYTAEDVSFDSPIHADCCPWKLMYDQTRNDTMRATIQLRKTDISKLCVRFSAYASRSDRKAITFMPGARIDIAYCTNAQNTIQRIKNTAHATPNAAFNMIISATPNAMSLYNEVLINNNPFCAEDLDMLNEYFGLMHDYCTLKPWLDKYDLCGILGEFTPENYSQVRISDILRKIDENSEWFDERVSKISNIINNGIFPNSLLTISPIFNDREHEWYINLSANTIIPYLNYCNFIADAAGLRNKVSDSVNILSSFTGVTLMNQMREALTGSKFDEYAQLYERYSVSLDERKLFAERQSLIDNKVKPVSPAWADELNANPGGEMSERVRNSLTLYRMNGRSFERFMTLYNDCLDARKEFLDKSRDLVSAEIALSIADKLRANDAVMAHMNGMLAGEFRRDALPALQNMGIVPIWIMSEDNAAELFIGTNTKFDVVIVDEASQSDLSCLKSLYLGKKLIIVGDDKQVSPDGSFVRNDQAEAVTEEYVDVDESRFITKTTSVYGMANLTITPIQLFDHFRCEPAIINFCNQSYYDGGIRPLKQQIRSTVKLTPIAELYVNGNYATDNNGGYNDAEVDVIVNLLKIIKGRPEYSGKSIGIVPMIGSADTNPQYRRIDAKLNEAFASSDPGFLRMIKIGVPRHFQGDERDVIIMSVVHNQPGNANMFCKKSTREKYNVAVSRAKEQLIVVHSINDNVLCTLPDQDNRKMLINYIRGLDGRMAGIEADSPAEFESSCISMLHDFDLIDGGMKLGKFSIPVVMEGSDKLVAVLCDSGDAARRPDYSVNSYLLDRFGLMDVLERAKIRFVQIFATEFARDPGCMSSLFNHLNNNCHAFRLAERAGFDPNEQFRVVKALLDAAAPAANE